MEQLSTRSKIICIGLPKSGTTSLHNALKMLGYKSIHFPYDKRTVRQVREGDYHLKVLEEHDAVSDVPIPAIYPQLDQAFPGSKFILTHRSLDSWLKSERNAPFNSNPPKAGSKRDFYRAILYGVTHYNEDRFRYVYEAHHALVDRYFADRPDDLLRLDLANGDGWEKLCPFLDMHIPNQPFPHSNKAGAYRYTFRDRVREFVNDWRN
jgi:hypothetical protein